VAEQPLAELADRPPPDLGEDAVVDRVLDDAGDLVLVVGVSSLSTYRAAIRSSALSAAMPSISSPDLTSFALASTSRTEPNANDRPWRVAR
jgi:hypothetical protein